MADQTGNSPNSPVAKSTRTSRREDRLAEALRENLKRRKQQKRARHAAVGEDEPTGRDE